MYIGKTKSRFKKRWSAHKCELRKGISGCRILQHAWNKYGEENFEFQIIAEGDFNKEELKELEEIFIKLYGNYNIQKVSKNLPQSIEKSKRLSKAHKKVWSDPEYKKQRVANMYTDAWELYPQVVEFWRDKNNGRGGCNHPGTLEIQNKFSLSRSIVDRMLTQIKQDNSIEIIEGFNEEEIYQYWLNSSNAKQAKYQHPGAEAISKQFNISEAKATSLVKKFKLLTNSTTTKSYNKEVIYLDWKNNKLTYKDIMSKYSLSSTKSFQLIKEFKQK
jgi:hypothetical protein